MPKASLLETQTVNLAEILGNGKTYHVPRYQRDYSWEEEQWEDLWTDLIAVADRDSQHYLGTVVFQTDDKKFHTIIDGQQRMATLSLLILSGIELLPRLKGDENSQKQNRERAELLRDRFLGSKDPASLVHSSKLFLNAHDGGFYKDVLLQSRKPVSIRKLRESERRLWNAREFFTRQLIERFTFEAEGADVARFLSEIVGERTLFIRIAVESELSAYTVFETLNARGLSLTVVDLLKNYLFSLVDSIPSDLDHVQRRWEKIVDMVGMEKFPSFLRHHLNSRMRLVMMNRLFKTLQAEVLDGQAVLNLLNNLETDAIWYKALEDPNDEFWLDHPLQTRSWIRALALFHVAQYRPLVLAAKDVFSPQDIESILRYCTVISFRSSIICQRNPNDLEKVYNTVALSIRANLKAGHTMLKKEIQEGLRAIYPTDEEFVSEFALRSLSTEKRAKLVRYILCELERDKSGADLDFSTSDATIEHILPENPSEEWMQAFPDLDRERWIFRLGNYTLLEPKLNQKFAGNHAFEIKREIYQESKYKLTSGMTDREWIPERIEARQLEMANRAKCIWRF